MKKRLISLLLAFSMMLTFLPAGAVSAFAEGTADDTTKGELLQKAIISRRPERINCTETTIKESRSIRKALW